MTDLTVNDSDYWSRVNQVSARGGGQGTGHLANGRKGERAFIKTLKRSTHRPSRARFFREATAYETVPVSPGVPRLYGHNAGSWQDAKVPLFIATQYVDGDSLREFVRSDTYAADLRACLRTTSTLVRTLGQCHESGVVHRDVKPDNVVISTPTDAPVLVDFGLSFNGRDEDSPLTRADEEVGNRFLRLPEHSTGGRSSISDVTQCAGVLFFMLTGQEPRVLLNELGEHPHQRPAARSIIERLTSTVERERLLMLFDRAFDTRMSARFQTAQSFERALEGVARTDINWDDHSAITSAFTDAAKRPAVENAGAASRDLAIATRQAVQVARALASNYGLSCSQGGGPDDYLATPPRAVLRLALAPGGVIPSHFAQFTILRLGPSDYRIAADNGSTLWRGNDVTSQAFSRSIEGPVMQLFAARGGDKGGY